MAHIRRSLELYSQRSDHRGTAFAEVALGRACRAAGHIEDAVAAFQRAVQLCERLGLQHWLARALAGLGEASADLGDQQAAVAHWQQALDLMRSCGLPETDQVATLLRDSAAGTGTSSPRP